MLEVKFAQPQAHEIEPIIDDLDFIEEDYMGEGNGSEIDTEGFPILEYNIPKPQVFKQSFEPMEAMPGDFWIDTSDNPNFVKMLDGSGCWVWIMDLEDEEEDESTFELVEAHIGYVEQSSLEEFYNSLRE